MADQTRPSFEEAYEIIGRLREDHNFFMHEFADATKSMRELLLDPAGKVESTERLTPLRQKIAEIVSRLEKHNRLEELEIYRWPAAIWDTQAQTLLADSMRRELENMPQRFRSDFR